MPNVGVPELLIVLVIVLVIFGARRVPEAGKNLGKGMREFKDAITGNKDDDRQELQASNEPQTTGQATAPPEQAAPAEQAPEREAARSGDPRR